MTDEYKALLGNPEPADVILNCVRLSNTNFTQDYFFVKSNKQHIGTIDASDETFEPQGFEFIPPKQSESGTEPMTFTIDATDRTVFDEIELASADRQDPIILSYWAFIKDNKAPQTDEASFILRNISYFNGVVTADASLDINNKSFSSQTYTTKRFPATKHT